MKTHTGFTLIEVLIAMLVIAVGLLGLAALQTTGLRNNLSAYHRSQATQLAYDLADRMRANVAGKASYTDILPSAATATANCLTTTGCTTSEMAHNDLFEWNRAVGAVLPNGSGTMPAPVANIFTITITWDDDRDGDRDADDTSFQTSFRL
jgi:type IV pilus assembly protein PilV